jgi:hypothetical protein
VLGLRFRRRKYWLALECSGRTLGRPRVLSPRSERDRASGPCGRVSSLSAVGGGHSCVRDIGWSHQSEDCVSLMAIRRRAGSRFSREKRSSTGFKPHQGEADGLERTGLMDPWTLVDSTPGERRERRSARGKLASEKDGSRDGAWRPGSPTVATEGFYERACEPWSPTRRQRRRTRDRRLLVGCGWCYLRLLRRSLNWRLLVSGWNDCRNRQCGRGCSRFRAYRPCHDNGHSFGSSARSYSADEMVAFTALGVTPLVRRAISASGVDKTPEAVGLETVFGASVPEYAPGFAYADEPSCECWAIVGSHTRIPAYVRI